MAWPCRFGAAQAHGADAEFLAQQSIDVDTVDDDVTSRFIHFEGNETALDQLSICGLDGFAGDQGNMACCHARQFRVRALTTFVSIPFQPATGKNPR
jgi:hypothetical protein